jgi:VIT1/CCC1 family predicted Fe2+/Mn2+ transporter
VYIEPAGAPCAGREAAHQPNAIIMRKINRISFGGTAAIVTSMALIVGLDAAHATEKTMISALLIAALADNLTDSLSVHIYQESERLSQREAFIGTLSNFATRLALCLSFAALIVLLAPALALGAALAWGTFLLAALSWVLARERGASPLSEVAKHLIVAALVLFVSRLIGAWINAQIGA